MSFKFNKQHRLPTILANLIYTMERYNTWNLPERSQKLNQLSTWFVSKANMKQMSDIKQFQTSE